jgi:type I restriction enzyme M protein
VSEFFCDDYFCIRLLNYLGKHILEQKELEISVKSLVSRLYSFAMTKEEVRNLLTILFLLRWMKDDLEDLVEYGRNEVISEVSSRLNRLFSEPFNYRQVEHEVRDLILSLRDLLHVKVLQNFELTTIRHSFSDNNCTVDAIYWLKSWGGSNLETRHEISQLFELIIQETATPSSSVFSSSHLLSQLVVGLAKPKSGERILDPCVGQGSFLVEAQRTIEASNTSYLSHIAFYGYDVSEDSLLIAIVRLLLSGTSNFSLDKRSGLSGYYTNDATSKLFDVVLAHPPAGLRNEGYRELAYQHNFPVITKDAVSMFIQQALTSLKPNGRAVIAVPEGLLFGRSNADIELRRYLVESGYLEAIVSLPSKILIENSGIRGALLLLHKAKKNRKIRMADLSAYFEFNLTNENGRLPNALAEELFNMILSENLPEPILLPKGMREGMSGTGVLTRAIWDVSIQDIANNEWNLTPKKKVDDSLSIFLEDYKDKIGRDLEVILLPKLAQIQMGRSIRITEQTDISNSSGYVRIRDVDNLKVKSITSWVKEDVANYHSQYRLYKDDILLSKTGTIGKLALVDSDSDGSFAASNFFVLKVNKNKILPQYLLSYLSSPFCQEWLDSRKRGAVQQHITKDAIENLPILLPSIELQHRAVSQYQQDGTDVLTFIKENSQQSESDWADEWLSELERTLELLDSNLKLESSILQLSEFAKRALPNLNIENALLKDNREWFKLVFKIFDTLRSIHKIPPGPVLLNILQNISSQLSSLNRIVLGNYNIEERIISLFVPLEIRIKKIINEVLNTVSVNISPMVNELEAGSNVEFNINILNESYLPLKNIIVETTPNIGCGDTFYLADKESMEVTLVITVSNTEDILDLSVRWQAENLVGQQVGGISELAIKIAKPSSIFKSFKLASNPYVTGSPLEPKSGAMVFYGRENLIQQMVSQIETQGNVILLEGNRRSGKTSILKHLEGVDTIPNWLVVYSSLQGAEGASGAVGVPTVEVFREIARSIASAITKLKIDVPLPDGKMILAGKPALGIARACKKGIGEDSPFIDFREYLEVLLSILDEKDLGIVLMLDEFDKLQEGIDNGVTSPQVPENLRYLIQNYSRFSAVLTGSRRLKRLREEYWSALYGLGTNLAVTALDKESAEKVVKEPVKDFIAFSNEAVGLILELTARQAYLIQKVCNRIFDYATTKSIHSIKSDDVLHVASELVKADEHFASLWDYAKLGPVTGGFRRQALLCILTKNFKNETLCTFGMLQEELSQKGINATDEYLDSDLSYLRELELIKLCGEIGVGHYRLEIPLMAEWIKIHEDEEIVIKNAVNEEGAISDR